MRASSSIKTFGWFLAFRRGRCLSTFVAQNWSERDVFYQKPMSRSMQLHYISVTAFLYTDLFLERMRLSWECHDQSQETNWRHCATGPELPFFHKRKGFLKIEQSVKMPWHWLSMGVAFSYSLAPNFVNSLSSCQDENSREMQQNMKCTCGTCNHRSTFESVVFWWGAFDGIAITV